MEASFMMAILVKRPDHAGRCPVGIVALGTLTGSSRGNSITSGVFLGEHVLFFGCGELLSLTQSDPFSDYSVRRPCRHFLTQVGGPAGREVRYLLPDDVEES